MKKKIAFMMVFVLLLVPILGNIALADATEGFIIVDENTILITQEQYKWFEDNLPKREITEESLQSLQKYGNLKVIFEREDGVHKSFHIRDLFVDDVEGAPIAAALGISIATLYFIIAILLILALWWAITYESDTHIRQSSFEQWNPNLGVDAITTYVQIWSKVQYYQKRDIDGDGIPDMSVDDAVTLAMSEVSTETGALIATSYANIEKKVESLLTDVGLTENNIKVTYNWFLTLPEGLKTTLVDMYEVFFTTGEVNFGTQFALEFGDPAVLGNLARQLEAVNVFENEDFSSHFNEAFLNDYVQPSHQDMNKFATYAHAFELELGNVQYRDIIGQDRDVYYYHDSTTYPDVEVVSYEKSFTGQAPLSNDYTFNHMAPIGEMTEFMVSNSDMYGNWLALNSIKLSAGSGTIGSATITETNTLASWSDPLYRQFVDDWLQADSTRRVVLIAYRTRSYDYNTYDNHYLKYSLVGVQGDVELNVYDKTSKAYWSSGKGSFYNYTIFQAPGGTIVDMHKAWSGSSDGSFAYQDTKSSGYRFSIKSSYRDMPNSFNNGYYVPNNDYGFTNIIAAYNFKDMYLENGKEPLMYNANIYEKGMQLVSEGNPIIANWLVPLSSGISLVLRGTSVIPIPQSEVNTDIINNKFTFGDEVITPIQYSPDVSSWYDQDVTISPGHIGAITDALDNGIPSEVISVPLGGDWTSGGDVLNPELDDAEVGLIPPGTGVIDGNGTGSGVIDLPGVIDGGVITDTDVGTIASELDGTNSQVDSKVDTIADTATDTSTPGDSGPGGYQLPMFNIPMFAILILMVFLMLLMLLVKFMGLVLAIFGIPPDHSMLPDVTYQTVEWLKNTNLFGETIDLELLAIDANYIPPEIGFSYMDIIAFFITFLLFIKIIGWLKVAMFGGISSLMNIGNSFLGDAQREFKGNMREQYREEQKYYKKEYDKQYQERYGNEKMGRHAGSPTRQERNEEKAWKKLNEQAKKRD